jgi:hypothetical protein
MKMLLIVFALLISVALSGQVTPEQLFFEIRYGIVKGGEATFQTKMNTTGNKEDIQAFLHGYTTGILDKLYPVDDQFESILSKDQLLPLKSSKMLKEQHFRLSEEVTFDHKREMAYSVNSGWQPVKYGICDIASLFCHMRYSGILDHLRPNQLIEIPFWDTGEWYMLQLKYTGIETISTQIGKIACIRLEPQKIAGRFFDKENPMNIWISNDSRKLPVLMEMNFTIGSVKCKLVSPPRKEGA